MNASCLFVEISNSIRCIIEEFMMSSNTIKRNQSIDIFRGIAMLLVVLGHTLSGCTLNYERTFLFILFWTLQMPLFMIISGYVTKYSKQIKDFKSLLEFVKKRSLSYLLPWLVWTIIIRGIVFQNTQFLNPSYLLWHMDSGYWFLTSLWTICMLFGVGQFLSYKIIKKGEWLSGTILTVMFSCICAIPLVVLGKLVGIGFLGIKLSLYYTPFFLIGFLFSKIENQFSKMNWYKNTVDVIVLLCGLVYSSLLVRVNVALLEDDLTGIAIRAVTSITGCITVFGFGSRIINASSNGKIGGGMEWVGIHSLEIYLIHYLVLAIIRANQLPDIHSMMGILYLVVNYLITVILSILIFRALNNHQIARRVFFAK